MRSKVCRYRVSRAAIAVAIVGVAFGSDTRRASKQDIVDTAVARWPICKTLAVALNAAGLVKHTTKGSGSVYRLRPTEDAFRQAAAWGTSDRFVKRESDASGGYVSLKMYGAWAVMAGAAAPHPLDPDRIKAEYRDDILHLPYRGSERDKPRTIKIGLTVLSVPLSTSGAVPSAFTQELQVQRKIPGSSLPLIRSTTSVTMRGPFAFQQDRSE